MNTHNRIGKWSVIFGIIIVLNLFINYALSLAYKSPDYQAFCPQTQVITQPATQKECTDKGGQWNGNTYYGKPTAPTGPTEITPATAGYCDLEFTCRQTYQHANDNYSRNVFVTLVIFGALMVLIGNFFKGNDVISSGLSLAGVLSFIIASIRYWGAANDLIRVIILAIALALLFWVAIKKFKN
jgi:hypothetical protein